MKGLTKKPHLTGSIQKQADAIFTISSLVDEWVFFIISTANFKRDLRDNGVYQYI